MQASQSDVQFASTNFAKLFMLISLLLVRPYRRSSLRRKLTLKKVSLFKKVALREVAL